MGSGEFLDQVEASVSDSTDYKVLWIESQATGLFGLSSKLVVAVEFPEAPSDDELKSLFSDVVAPFPDGSTERVSVHINVAGDREYSLEDQVGEWFPRGTTSDREVTTEVSVYRDAIGSQ